MSALLPGFVALTLVHAAAGKVLDPRTFRGALRGYTLLRRLPRPAIRALAVGVPVVELATGVALLIPTTSRAATIPAVALLASFYVLIAKDRRPSFANCGCAGAAVVAAPKRILLLRNGILVGVGLATAAAVWTAGPEWSIGELAVAAGLVLPFALLLMELPLIAHIVQLDKANMPARLAQARAQQAAARVAERHHEILSQRLIPQPSR